MIFDIETIPYNFESLDEHTKEYVLRGTTENTLEEEQAKLKMGLSPFLGQIVAIGIIPNLSDNRKPVVYFDALNMQAGSKIQEGNATLIVANEEQMLRKFWEYAGYTEKSKNSFITFNGRSFDAPFIMVRSLIYRIQPTATLVPSRYDNRHIDLKDRLSVYGALKWPSFHLVCRHLGIDTPKADITGASVFDAYQKEEYVRIARYCARDIIALEKVFEMYFNYFI